MGRVGDVDNVTYQCRRVQMPTPWVDEDEVEGGVADDGGDDDAHAEDDEDDDEGYDSDYIVDLTQD